MYKHDLALNNLHGRCAIKPNQTKPNITISKEARLEKLEGKHRKGKQITTIIPTCNILELNELFYVWAKLVFDKIVVP